MPKIETLRSVAALRAALAPLRKKGERIGLVPTMGALHDGHLSLVAEAARHAPHVVVSIFVNPTQFAPQEDFAAYPRNEAADLKQLETTAARFVFAPSVEEMYPPGDSTTITLKGPAQGLEGDARPGHFAGVATVVAKLLIQCAPDISVFGEKDYQQLLVIKRLVMDLGLPVDILGAPILRDKDGLALSSRNVYLSAEERKKAPALHAALREAGRIYLAGASRGEAEKQATAQLLGAGFASVDYLTIRDAGTLALIEKRGDRGRVLGAARLGKTRLIDNIAL
jgi:pantoate--beta-alanine ligase